MTTKNVIAGIGVIASAVAAILWLRASAVDVPDNIDTIVAALHLASELNTWAAAPQCFAAACLGLQFWEGIEDTG
ncbi:MAG TPA: hypothetical protein VF175_13200 [Lacipirellula sp.]|jgi:ActR/RegA family two-component response regulator